MSKKAQIAKAKRLREEIQNLIKGKKSKPKTPREFIHEQMNKKK